MPRPRKPLSHRSHQAFSTSPTAGRALLQLLLAVVLLAGAAACGGGLLGGGDTGPYDRPDETQITGEVERVEEYSNEIDVWTADRRIVTVRYEHDTPVYYEGNRHDPTALEQGDVIEIAVERTPSGAWLAQRIDVVEALQDRDVRNDSYDPDPGYQTDDDRRVEGEIVSVDLDRRRVEIDTGRERRILTFGLGTPVYFRGGEYEVTGLEPGDVIRADVDTRREPWRVIDFITVVQSRQERERYGDEEPYDGPYDEPYSRPDDDQADAERFSGTVQEVDARRGEFTLDTERYGLKTVAMPYDASRQDRTEFDQLRRGQFVRIEGKRQSGDRIELYRFGWGDR